MDTSLYADSLMRNWRENLDWAGLKVRLITETKFKKTNISVLDVGAGKGKYRLVLPEYPNVDAVEIWEPYVEEHRLRELYRTVYVRDVAEVAEEFSTAGVTYDLVVMGDVLEHLSAGDASWTIRCLRDVTRELIVIVPYSYAQGPEHGNPYQRHEQDDLTVELMHERYPDLRLDMVQVDGADRPFKGLYRWR